MMNDRFKFRARHDGKWLHLYEKLGGCSILGETIILGGWLDGVKLSELDDIVIEQCTGLKDKHGKLIYEGDILQSIDEFGRAECRYSVLWNPEYCCFYAINSDPKLNGFSFCRTVPEEIIGNIHENPELLK